MFIRVTKHEDGREMLIPIEAIEFVEEGKKLCGVMMTNGVTIKVKETIVVIHQRIRAEKHQ